jgi:hypothetical protein
VKQFILKKVSFKPKDPLDYCPFGVHNFFASINYKPRLPMCSCDFGMPKIHSRTPTHHAHHNLLVSKIINNSQLKGNGGSNAFKKMAGNLHLLL